MTWVWTNRDLIVGLTAQHLLLALPSIVLSLLLAVPLARLTLRAPAARRLLLGTSSVLYAIPSLALFVVLPGVLGTGILDPLNVLVALTLYAMALMVRTASEAFAAIEPDVLLSATAQGHGRWQRFVAVELPQAGPAILAGLRVVSASTLSLVSVGALIGVQSLGTLFTEGYARGFLLEIAVGIVATVLLAVALDLLILGIGRATMPWAGIVQRAGAVA